MKRISLLMMCMACMVCAVAKTNKVQSVEPPYWWTGMANDTLQVMIHGTDIAGTTASVNYPGVSLIDDVATDSPNYKILYFTIGDNTRPGTMKIELKGPKTKISVPFELKARTWTGADNPGFDASDVLYLIMPDRFADGNTANNAVKMRYDYTTDRSRNNSRHGGDIQGMRNHLDYIDSLGVTAVWVNPVLENDTRGGSYHGYATTDFYRIDPRFGTNDEWRDFVADAHSRGIKVVMDMIFNHSGYTHPWIEDKPQADWLNHPEYAQTNFRLSTLHDPYASDYDRDRTVNGWFVFGMPDLNQRNPHLMKYLIQNSIFWIEDSRIDGIRMDTYPYADQQAMARWIADVEREYPQFNIVGECWYQNEGGEAFWQRGSRVNPVDPNLRTVMDFKYVNEGREAFSKPGGLNQVYEHLALDYLFPDPQHILTFLDNHDTDRFLDTLPDNLDWWKQAQTVLLTSRGIPQIYYGTEILMNGTRANGGDGNIRRDMPGGFPGDSVSVFTREGRTPMQAEAFDFLSRLLHWRKGDVNDIIARGSLKHFIPEKGVYVYERRLGDRAIIVILNGTDEEVTVPTARYAEVMPVGASYSDFISGAPFVVDENLTLAPRQILILQ